MAEGGNQFKVSVILVLRVLLHDVIFPGMPFFLIDPPSVCVNL
jgi:hypothetical protein